MKGWPHGEDHPFVLAGLHVLDELVDEQFFLAVFQTLPRHWQRPQCTAPLVYLPPEEGDRAGGRRLEFEAAGPAPVHFRSHHGSQGEDPAHRDDRISGNRILERPEQQRPGAVQRGEAASSPMFARLSEARCRCTPIRSAERGTISATVGREESGSVVLPWVGRAS